MIDTGPDIIDIDHLFPSMSDFATLLGPYQVFSGIANPVTTIHYGTTEIIKHSVVIELKTNFWLVYYLVRL